LLPRRAVIRCPEAQRSDHNIPNTHRARFADKSFGANRVPLTSTLRTVSAQRKGLDARRASGDTSPGLSVQLAADASRIERSPADGTIFCPVKARGREAVRLVFETP
jgi:hypothetical protein